MSTIGISRRFIRMRSERRGKLGLPSSPERDQFAVEHERTRQVVELGGEVGHVPAAAAADLAPRLGRDERPKPSHFTSSL
jgi:hypothetical protein